MLFRMLFCTGFLVDKGREMLIWQSNTRNSFSFLFFFFSTWFRAAGAQFYTIYSKACSVDVWYFWKPAEFKQLLKVSGFSLLCCVWRDAKSHFWQRILAFLRNVTYHELGLHHQEFLNLCLVDSEVCYKNSFGKMAVWIEEEQCVINQGTGGLSRDSSPGRCCQGGLDVGEGWGIIGWFDSVSACCWPMILQIVFCVRQFRKLLLSLVGTKKN